MVKRRLQDWSCLWDGQLSFSSWVLLVNVRVRTSDIDNPTYAMELASRGKLKGPKTLRLQGNQVPTADVFVPCCGEDLDVILDTTRAATALDYPYAKFRVVVLDDSDSAEVQTTDIRIPNVYYTANNVKSNTHSKAGNLNHGLDFIRTLSGFPSEFIAVLDVDRLRALLPHILQMKKS